MNFEVGRCKRILEDLEKLMWSDGQTIEEFKFCDVDYFMGMDVPRAQEVEAWRDYRAGELWGGYDKHRWIGCNIKVPEGFNERTIVFKITTGHEGEWDALNPQFLCYVDGRIVQGLDVNHREVLLSERAMVGRIYSILLLGYSGLVDAKTILTAQLLVLDREIEELYYNIKVPLAVAELLNKQDYNRINILSKLEEAINLLDLRQIYSENFYQSLRVVNAYLKSQFYERMDFKAPLVTAIGHTHIDIAWLWTVSQTKEKAIRSFSTVLELMREYKEYKFMSSQPQLYEYIKEYEPEMYEEIKQRVYEGRWEVDGAMWLEADCNLPSGEALVRQILFGMRFFKEEFGVTCKSLWLPDVFGYSAALPQILKKSGISYFMTTKIDWNQYNTLPNDTFMWRGLDGSEVFTHLITTCDYDRTSGDNITFTGKNNKTTYTGDINANQVLGTWHRYQNKDINNETLMAFGFGDGGGGPTKEMLEQAKRLKYGLPGCPRLEIGFEGSFFDRIYEKLASSKKLPSWVGELYLEYHRGTYTSMAKSKRYNRKCEFMLQDEEVLSTFSMVLGENYPTEEINKGWKTLLLNQFHDIIPGSSIKKVYDESYGEYEEIIKNGNDIISSSIKKISEKIELKKKSLIVFNTMSYLRDDLVELQIPEGYNIKAIEDLEGNNIPIQYIENSSKLIFFASDIPSKGFKVFNLIEEEMVAAHSINYEKPLTDNYFENKFFKVKFDKEFNIETLYDKLNAWDVLLENKRGNVIEAFEDRPMKFDNWDIDVYYQKKKWKINNVKTAKLIECGPVRYCIKLEREFLSSKLTQFIYFYENIPRIDFKTSIDWKEKSILLKVAFPVNVNSNKATYEIQYGNIERETHNNTSWEEAKFEVCGHKWVDFSDGGNGVSLLNDCKYGHDIKNGIMRLTLLKSGTYPNPEADLGIHEFTYSIYPHKNTWREAGTQIMAYNLNVPLYTKIEEAHAGELDKSMSLISIDKENCIIEVVKKAEKNEGIIIRVFEYMNKREEVKISFFKELTGVWECDLLENVIDERSFQEGWFKFNIKPYEIKTFLINTHGHSPQPKMKIK